MVFVSHNHVLTLLNSDDTVSRIPGINEKKRITILMACHSRAGFAV